MVGIYKITNKVNGKVYIGESLHINQRWEEHKQLLENGSHHSKKLQNDYNTYGIDNFIFEVLEELNYDNLKPIVEKSLLIIYEDKYIKEYDSINKGYNIENTLELVLKGEKSIFDNGKSIVNQRGAYVLKSILKNIENNNGIYVPSNKKTSKENKAKNNKRKDKNKKVKLSNNKNIFTKENIKIIIDKIINYKFNEEFLMFSNVLKENGFNVVRTYQLLRDINIMTKDDEGNKFILKDESMFKNKEYITYKANEINRISYTPYISRKGFKFIIKKVLEYAKNNNIIVFKQKFIKENLTNCE